MAKKDNSIWILLAVIGGIFILSGMNFSTVANPEANGDFTLTDLGNGLYRLDLIYISDSGRAINYYYNRGSPANMMIGNWATPPDVDINPDNLVVEDNQMFLQTSCIKSPVSLSSIERKTNEAGKFWYVTSITRSFGSPYCNGGQCQADCDANVGAYTKGYMILKDTTVQPPQPICGNGVQEAGEDCSTCFQDSVGCGTTNPCGNGIVDAGESCETCPRDMPAGACNVTPPIQYLTGLWFYVIVAVIIVAVIFVWRR